MQKIRGMIHDEGPSQAPRKSSGISRSRSTRSSGMTGQGSHFPQRGASMRERVPPQTGTATTPPAKQRATGEVPVANGAPKAAPEKAEPAANGALGTGKATANGDISPDVAEQKIAAQAEEPRFPQEPVPSTAPETDTAGAGDISEAGPVGRQAVGGGAITPTPIPATAPEHRETAAADEHATKQAPHKHHTGVAATIAGATAVVAAVAVGAKHGTDNKSGDEAATGAEKTPVETQEPEPREPQPSLAGGVAGGVLGREAGETQGGEEKVALPEEEHPKVSGFGGVIGKNFGCEAEGKEGGENTTATQQNEIPKISGFGAVIGKDLGCEAEGPEGGEETAAPLQKESSKASGVGGIVPGKFPSESEGMSASDGGVVGANRPAPIGGTTAAGYGGAGEQPDTTTGFASMQKGYTAPTTGIVGGGGGEELAENFPRPTADAGPPGAEGIGSGAAEKAAPIAAKDTTKDQPVQPPMATSAAHQAGIGGGGGGVGTATAAGVAGVAGVAGGAGMAQKMGGEKAMTEQQTEASRSAATEEAEKRQLEEERLRESKAEAEARAHERAAQEKKQELEKQKHEAEELKEKQKREAEALKDKQKQTEKEVKEEKEAASKEKALKKQLEKEEKGHEKVIEKEKKKREKEAKAREKKEAKERKKQPKEPKQKSPDGDANGSASGKKEESGGGGLFGFFGRRLSHKGGKEGEASKGSSEGSKANGKQPMKPDTGTGAGNFAAESKTNGTIADGARSMQSQTKVGEASGMQRVPPTEAFPKLDSFPNAAGGGTVTPGMRRIHSGPQFRANIPTYVTP